MDWLVAIILFVICAVIFFFVGWAVGIAVYEKEHLINRGGLYMHEDEPITIEPNEKSDDQSEPIDAMQMLIEGWCDDCDGDISACMNCGYCKASYKGGDTDER